MTDPTDSIEPHVDPGSYGRVGYGKLARFSPALLAAVIAIAVVVIALTNRYGAENPREMIGRPAPQITMTGFDGSSTELSSLQGNVVVLNFWAAWCDPCKREMPAFQKIHEDGANDVRIIGVDIRNDKDAAAFAFLIELGVTYKIVKDSDASIEEAFGLGGSYPVTVIITPDGEINAIRIGEMTESEIREAVAEARSA